MEPRRLAKAEAPRRDMSGDLLQPAAGNTTVDSFSGTYLQTFPSTETIPGLNDHVRAVLYLFPSRRFLGIACWTGFETTWAAGEWSRDGSRVSVRAVGDASHCEGGFTGGEFTATYVLSTDAVGEVMLNAERQASDDWSLLASKGPFVRVGETAIVDFRPNALLPDLAAGWVDLDAWVRDYLSER